MLIDSAFKTFLQDQYARGNSNKTLSDYVTKLSIFVDYCNNHNKALLEEVDLPFLQAFVIELRCSNISSVSVQSYVRSLRAFLNYCYRSGFIPDDICNRFKLPKAKRDVIDILTDTEIKRLYGCFPNEANQLHLRNRVIISLMLDSGLRLHEVVSLKRSDLHLDDRLIIINGKGAKQRYVTFGDLTASYLLKYVALARPIDHLLYYFDDFGSQIAITDTTVKQLFRKLKQSSGISRLYPHLLRHTFATKYLENGGDIYTLQMLLGHSSLDMVKKYLHLSQKRTLQRYLPFSPLDNMKKPSSIDDGSNSWCSCGESNSGHLD